MRRTLLSILAPAVLGALLSPNLHAQGILGSLTGTVKDPSGAVIAGAELRITDKDRGVTVRAQTTEAGVYTAPHLPPAAYRVETSAAGFKTAVAEAIVHVGKALTMDFTLQLGGVTEQIEVTAAAPLVETSTPQIGQLATTKEFHTWPVVMEGGIRQLQNFIMYSLPGTQGGTWKGSINGSQSYSHPILVEGLPIGVMTMNGASDWQMSPGADTVDEFKLHTGTLSAQYGATQTAVANFAIKSGTNRFRGSLFWLHRNEALTANTWANNLTGQPKSRYRENSLGGTLGGPIRKDRTHFFVSYEGNRQQDQQVGPFVTLPVRDFKTGNFSRLLDPRFTGDPKSGTAAGTDVLGRSVVYGQIYDPASTRQVQGAWVRDPFAGNVIPQQRFSSVSRKIVELAPTPDPVLDQFRLNNPSLSNCCPALDVDMLTMKINHEVNQSHRLSGYFTYSRRDRWNGNPNRNMPFPGAASSTWAQQSTPGRILRLSEDWTISPTMLNHVAFGFNRFRSAWISGSAGEDWPGKIGLQNVGKATFPRVAFGANSPTLGSSLAQMANINTGDTPQNSFILADDLSWVRGKHNLRFGLETQRFHHNSRAITNGGTFNFHSEQTSLPGFVTSTGFSYASFLLGAVRNASLTVNSTNSGARVWYQVFYVQDDYKVNSKLTLNYGVRWEIPGALREVANRMSGLDPSKPNSGADNYPGALVFLGNCSGCNGRSAFTGRYWRQFAPRFGFAFSADGNTVVRGGYGINYSAPLLNAYNTPFAAGYDGNVSIAAGTGRFAQDATLMWDQGMRPFTGALPNYDPAQRNGAAVSYLPPDSIRQPYVQNWNLGIQRVLPWATVLEVNYIGNKGTRLEMPGMGGFLNQLNPAYLALGDALLEDIGRHPEIAKPYPSFRGTVARALRPFPQYESVGSFHFFNGFSTYHSLQATATKRTQAGLSFLAAYTFSKALANADSTMDSDGTVQDFYNRAGEKSVTSMHRPHSFRLSWIYDLPFKDSSRWMGRLLGGWTVSGIHEYQSGRPLSVTASGYSGTALFNPGMRADVLLPAEQQVVYAGGLDSAKGTPYLNPAAFGKPPATANGVALRFGTAPRFLPNVRGPAYLSQDVSLMKKTRLYGEQTNLELRADILNVMNHPALFNPITNANDPMFGRILRKGGDGLREHGIRGGTPRTVQFSLRLNF